MVEKIGFGAETWRLFRKIDRWQLVQEQVAVACVVVFFELGKRRDFNTRFDISQSELGGVGASVQLFKRALELLAQVII